MPKIVQRLEQSQKLNPRQILEQNIIQLSVFNLEKRIIEELEQNPALEIVENEEEVNDKENDENEEFDFEELVSNPEEYEYSKKTSATDTIEKMREQTIKKFMDKATIIYKEDNTEDYFVICKKQTCSSKLKNLEEVKNYFENL